MKDVKKIVSVLALMLLMLITLTGCVSVQYEVNIKEDGTADASMIMGYSKEFLSSMGVEEGSEDYKELVSDFDDMKADMEDEDYTAESYEDDEIIGIKATKKADLKKDSLNLQEVFGEQYISNDEKGEIVFEKNFLKTRFSQQCKVDLTEMAGESEEENAVIKSMTLKYKVTLPFKANENNATTVSNDGKTLEWNLKAGEVTEVKFEAQQDIMLLVCGGVALVVILVIVIAVVATRDSKKKKENANGENK